MKKLVGLIAMMLILGGLTAAPALGKPHNPVERPYKVTASGTSGTTSCDPFDIGTFTQTCYLALSGTSVGTHIGKATVEGTGVAVIEVAAEFLPPFPPFSNSPHDTCDRGRGAGNHVTADQDGTVVAPDGSTLTFHNDWQGCSVPEVGTDADGTQTIESGTRRFAGATGTATFSVTADVVPTTPFLNFTNEIDGTITF